MDERKTAELGLASAKELDRLDQRVDASIDEVVERLRSTLDALKREHRLDAKWQSLDAPASVVVPQHARCAVSAFWARTCQPTLILSDTPFPNSCFTGRPVLFVPAFGSFDTLGRHIVVAWNSSRASARAVNDALPLIERAEQTTVITVNPADFIERHGALPAEQMVEHLRRHSAELYRNLGDGVKKAA